MRAERETRPRVGLVSSVFARIEERWPTIARDGLIATGGVCILLGGLALVGSTATRDPDIARVFVAGGVALAIAGAAATFRVGERFVTGVMTSMTGGSFALVLADMTSTPIDAPDRYSSLRWVILLATTLIGLLVFQDGFRSRAIPHHPAGPPQRRPAARAGKAKGKGRRLQG